MCPKNTALQSLLKTVELGALSLSCPVLMDHKVRSFCVFQFSVLDVFCCVMTNRVRGSLSLFA